MAERILPTLSLENRLGTFCQDQGMSLDFFAAVADQRVSASRLRVAIRGEKDLEQPAAAVIDTLLGELRALAKEYEPFKLQWVNPQLFREQLEKRRRGAEPFHVAGSGVQAPGVQVQPVDRTRIETSLNQRGF